jgi:hypothetical protein
MIRWLAILLVGCVTHEPATITTKRLVGAYRIGDFVRERTVFNSPTTVPQCCLGIWRRTQTTLELVVGGPLVTARIYIEDVLAAAPQRLELGPTNTRAYVSQGRGSPTLIEVFGALDLGIFHCDDDPDELGCALTGKGAWDLSSADGTFSTNGWFESADSVGPLTF